MNRKTRIILIILSFLGLIGTTVATQGIAKATPPVQLCSNLGGCMNRAGGGGGSGTPVILWSQNNNNNDFSYLYLNSWCSNGRVHNGENGILCPFRNGSGLNARYDGAAIYALDAYAQIKEVTIPNFTTGKAVLGNLGDQGYAFVRSSQGFVVSIGMSNAKYDAGGGSNQPYWINAPAQLGDQLVVYNRADDIWTCVGTGTDNC